VDVEREPWLLEQKPDHYTIVLFATAKEDSIVPFLRREGFVRDSVAYFRFERNGKVLYSVVYGSFPGYSFAKRALAKLPTALRKNAPWVREFGPMQDLIREYRKNNRPF
jgi:DamX protein